MIHATSPNQQAIEAFAARIVERRLETPVILFLESQKPLSAIFLTTALAFEPIGALLFTRRPFDILRGILGDRAQCEALIQRIELLSAERNARKSGR